MKKIVVTLMLSLFCLMVQGQAHMKFMGIPLTGHVDLFTQKLKAKGLTCDFTDSNVEYSMSTTTENTVLSFELNIIINSASSPINTPL